MFANLRNMVAPQSIAVDLGTANTRIYAAGIKALTEESSLVRHCQACGNAEAADPYVSYVNSRYASMPLRGGVIVDLKSAISLLRPLLRRSRKGLRRPASLACAPTDTSERERELLADAIINAGAGHVAIVPEVWAAALGAGLDTTRPSAQVLVDIGEGVTDMAVIRGGRIIYSSAVRTACSDLQKAIRSAVISRYGVGLFPAEAERLTHEISAMSESLNDSARLITVEGMDLINKRYVKIEVSCADAVGAMAPVMERIVGMINRGLRNLSQNAGCEILESGLCLTGGGALIRGMDKLLAARTEMSVIIAPDPIHSVIKGASQILDYWQGYDHWWENISWPEFQQSNP